MRNVKEISVARGAGNQELLPQGIDGLIDHGDFPTELPNRAGILRTHNGLNGESIGVMVELFKKVAGIRADASDQPTGVDGDGLRHVSSLPKMDEAQIWPQARAHRS